MSLASKIAAGTKPRIPHLIVEALAGTGKTTTLIEGLRPIFGSVSTLTPSPQQKAVWDSIALSKGASSVAFCAFNAAIAKELKERVPTGAVAMTMHSLGNRAVTAAFGKLGDINEWRVSEIICEILGKDIRDMRATPAEFDILRTTSKLVDLCKVNLVQIEGIDPADWAPALEDLVSHYEVEIEENKDRIYSLVPRVLDRCKNVDKDRRIDFCDMIWLPVVLNLPITQYDLLLVDECQDLSRCQQALAKRAGRRLIFCGDKHQAIYGFAGADAESMIRLERELADTEQGCDVLPLTVTRRCGKAIVKEAQQIVPQFEAHEDNGLGLISWARYKPRDEEDGDDGRGNPNATYHARVENGDMVLCRVNAPLVSQCFKFLREGRKAEIQGRDIGRGLVKTVNKMKASDVPDLVGKLSDWVDAETNKELAKRTPSDATLIGLSDRYACLLMFTEHCRTVDQVISRIESVFTDQRYGAGIKLSSIHKSKGLEARRVFLLEPDGASVPHPAAKADWQVEQEWNLRYVAITRAIEELVYVK